MGVEDRTCWVLQAGPRSRYAPDFVTGQLVSIAWEWDALGDLSATEDAEIFLLLEAAGRRKPAEDLRELRIFTDRIAVGDVIVVPDAPDLLFGEVVGPYDHAVLGGVHRHVRPVRWFGRLAADQVEDFLVAGTKIRQLVKRLPEQLHWQRLAGEVEDFLGRPADDMPVRARAASVRRGGGGSARGTTRAPAKPTPVAVPDRLCPGCGLLRSPSLYDEGEEYCRDCA